MRAMTISRLLIANRGEIAIRIARAAAEFGARSVAVHGADDAGSLHTRMADEAAALPGRGPAAWLDSAALIDAARARGCDAAHPGYGFLAENAEFAEACAAAGLAFVGPAPETLRLFGDKARARAAAQAAGLPVLAGTPGAATLADARAFLAARGALMVKALAGGGGRGMRAVRGPGELEAAWERCRSEAEAAFGDGRLYVEELADNARHVEVQIVGDGTGRVVHAGERACSLQRRHQKLVETAPAPGLDDSLREALAAAAVRLGESVRYANLGTVEFLVDGGGRFAFIEANARLQVEHTVTEAVTGLDLVRLQLELASGRTLDDLGLDQASVPAPSGCAIQVRVNLETMTADGGARPTGGTLTAFDPPSGPGVRVDTYGYAGYRTDPRFDSLLAKVVAHAPRGDFAAAAARASRALSEFRIAGAATNIGFLQALLARPELADGSADTGFVAAHAAALAAAAERAPPPKHFDPPTASPGSPPAARGRAGAAVDPVDPLAVLDHGRSARPDSPADTAPEAPDGAVALKAPMQGTIVSLDAEPGAPVPRGGAVLVMEAMKMEHVVAAETAGLVAAFAVAVGDTVFEGDVLAFVEPREVADTGADSAETVDPDAIRPDLAEVRDRHALGLDPARPDAVARRRRIGHRTARENVDDLCDPGSFVEYGPLVIAAQRQRRSVDDLIRRTPADGLVAGIGSVNGAAFPGRDSRCVVMAYDYMVLAGTQGFKNHEKKDRMFALAEKWRLPVVFFTEGGGGRPGDTDGAPPAGLHVEAFRLFGRLSGLVPLVGIASGRCFAGNAALLGCCDVTIATADSTIGMGGPAMIEGGGLGVFRPEEVGPMAVQRANGVVDIAVEDEAEAVRAAKKYLACFQGATAGWECADQRLLRAAIPENRLRVYDVRKVIDLLADAGSVLELRRDFGPGMVTALVRVEGRPLGLVANNPRHLAGAIDSDGADKAARFMQLCDAHDLPLLVLCDTPGMMVGPEVEKTALVRHCCRLFVTGASLEVPVFAIVLRKAYGLGAQAMAGGGFRAPMFTVAWPTGEFGGMGLEGFVKLGYRKELEAVADPAERKALFDEMVARAYDHGKALNTASHFEFDDVIDPAESRRWIVSGLDNAPPRPRTGKRRPNIDTW